MLVSTRGSEEIKLIQDNFTFQAWCRFNNVKVFSFSSKFGNYENFEREDNRTRVYNNLKGLQNSEDCILLHIDILTEGIDLPSITGVLLLRHLNEAKLFQSLGRALRLLDEDRKRLYSGELMASDKEHFIKPYAYLILPMHFEKMDEDSIEMRRTVERVINEYQIPTEEFTPPEEYDGKNTNYLDPVTDRDSLNRREKNYPLRHLFEDIVKDSFSNNLPEGEEGINILKNMLENLSKEENNA